jgi:dephospho-CoA kinase
MVATMQVPQYRRQTVEELGLTQVQTKESRPFSYRGIAISGKIASGKTTVANYLAAKYGLPVSSFATALKRSVFDALIHGDLEIEDTDWTKFMVENKHRLRGILQEWGTIFREINGEDHWTKKLFAKKSPFIVDDMRFQAEFDYLRKRGFLLIRLYADQDIRLDRISRLYPDMPSSALWHRSEIALDEAIPRFDILLDTNRTIAETISELDDRLRHFHFTFGEVDYLREK